MNDKEESRCSFCLRPVSKVKVLIRSKVNDKHICDSCVEACKEVVDRKAAKK